MELGIKGSCGSRRGTGRGLNFGDGGLLKCGFKLGWAEEPTVGKLLSGGLNPKGPMGRLGQVYFWFKSSV